MAGVTTGEKKGWTKDQRGWSQKELKRWAIIPAIFIALLSVIFSFTILFSGLYFVGNDLVKTKLNDLKQAIEQKDAPKRMATISGILKLSPLIQILSKKTPSRDLFQLGVALDLLDASLFDKTKGTISEVSEEMLASNKKSLVFTLLDSLIFDTSKEQKLQKEKDEIEGKIEANKSVYLALRKDLAGLLSVPKESVSENIEEFYKNGALASLPLISTIPDGEDEIVKALDALPYPSTVKERLASLQAAAVDSRAELQNLDTKEVLVQNELQLVNQSIETHHIELQKVLIDSLMRYLAQFD